MNPSAELKLRNGTNGLKVAQMRMKVAHFLDDFPRPKLTNMSQKLWSHPF